MSSRLPAIPFIMTERNVPPVREESIFEALKPAFPGIADLHLAHEAGRAFYGSNLALRNCTISSGVHPAIHVRSSATAGTGDVAFLMCLSGRADFRFGRTWHVPLHPMKAALFKSHDWEGECGDYGGLVIRLPEQQLLASLSLAMGRSARIEDIETFDLSQETGLGLRRYLHSLQMIFSKEIADSGLYDESILTMLALFIAQSRGSGDARVQQRMKRVVDSACRIIRDNLKSDLSIAELARTLGVSERYLQLVFQSILGTSPKQWMMSEKLNAAKQDIVCNPSLKLARLAEEYAFSSPAHFSTAFRKAFGVSPNRLRR